MVVGDRGELFLWEGNIENIMYSAGKISIEHVNIFLSKFISNWAVGMKCSPDVGGNPSNPHIEKNTLKIKTYTCPLCLINKVE